LPHIFDRFYRVPSADAEKGLGLGLSFVAWIAKAHGGAVTVESTLQQGTRFTVQLPVGRWSAVPPTTAAETPAAAIPERVH
jgi:two-component system OmpR family sensor kinase